VVENGFFIGLGNEFLIAQRCIRQDRAQFIKVSNNAAEKLLRILRDPFTGGVEL
jgi:hypothetical protein